METAPKSNIEAQMRSSVWFLALAVSILSEETTARAATTITFDVPGATYTEPAAINNSGTITGRSAVPGRRGFVRDANGTITSFVVKGAKGTYPMGINRQGVITGYYTDQRVGHGFIRNRRGRITRFDVGSLYTEPFGIDDSGAVAGQYWVSVNPLIVYGFVRAFDGTVTTFNVSGAVSTFVAFMNGKGESGGWYQLPDGKADGFVRAPDGTITTYDVDGQGATYPAGISADGATTGFYNHGSDQSGFVRDRDGNIVTFDAPSAWATEPAALDDAGTVAGSYYVSGGHEEQAFLRSKSGRITNVDVRGQSLTYPFAINASGVVTGDCYDGTGFHGFIRTP